MRCGIFSHDVRMMSDTIIRGLLLLRMCHEDNAICRGDDGRIRSYLSHERRPALEPETLTTWMLQIGIECHCKRRRVLRSRGIGPKEGNGVGSVNNVGLPCLYGLALNVPTFVRISGATQPRKHHRLRSRRFFVPSAGRPGGLWKHLVHLLDADFQFQAPAKRMGGCAFWHLA